VSLRVQRREVFDAALVRALDVEPANVAALKLLGNTLYLDGRYLEAAKAYYQILHYTRNDVDVLLALGNCFYQSGDRVNACLSFEEVLKIDPANAVATANLKIASPASSASSAAPAR
jgi:Flp pilus assembly protein TadD